MGCFSCYISRKREVYDKSYQRRTVFALVEREGPGQGQGAKMSMRYIQGDKFAGYSDMVSHMCIRNCKCFINDAMVCVFDVLSLNTAGIGDNFERRKISNYLKKSCSSKGIVLPQETYSTARNEAMWTNQWGCEKDSVAFSHGTSNSKGVLIAFRESANNRILSAQCDANGRYTILDLEIDNCPFILINYYAPNDECQQLQVLEEISNNVDKLDFKENTQLI